MATREQIMEWFTAGMQQGYEFMLVVCDEFDWSDYPVYCNSPEFPKKYVEHHNRDTMSKVMESYDLKASMRPQLAVHRAANYPAGFVPNER